MGKEWYRYNIFVSSTFKDMDAERDAIKFDVIPRLNWHYREQRVSFQTVDLRIGINTESASEEESENMVLDVCLANIDKSRPFFIGLLGHRYGWIPSEERWEYIVNRLSSEKRQLLKDSRNCSVTEMEILYGAIGNKGQYLNHSLFFFRDEKSYEGMTAEQKKAFFNADDPSDKSITGASLSKREENLKNLIISTAWWQHKSDTCIGYTLKWDTEKGRFNNMRSFSDLVFDELCREIDKEVHSNHPPQSWQEQESLSQQYRIERYADDKVRLTGMKRTAELAMTGGQILLTGSSGCGKSVAFAMIAKQLQERDDCKAFVAFCGSSNHSYTMLDIAKRWIFEAEIFLHEDTTADDKLSSLTSQKLYDRLQELLGRIACQGVRPVLMLDAIERFAYSSPQDMYLAWLPDSIAFVGTAMENVENITLHHEKMKAVGAEIRNPEAVKFIGRNHEVRFNVELPSVVRHDIVSGKLQPGAIDFLMRMFTNLSQDDFCYIRNMYGQSEIQKINNYLEHLYRSVPITDMSNLFASIVDFILRRIDTDNSLKEALQFIALSGAGLNEEDLGGLLGNRWDSLRFHKLISILEGYLTEDVNTHRWCFANPIYRLMFYPESEKERTMRFMSLANLMADYPDYEQQKQDLFFYFLIEAGESSWAHTIITDIEYNHKHRNRNWYEISLIYLLQDRHLSEKIKKVCENFTDEERMGFAYYLYMSVPENTQLLLLCHVESYVLKSVEAERLSLQQAYRMGTFYSHLFTTHKIKFNPLLNMPQGDISLAPYYLWRSIEGFKYCYSVDPDYCDTRNMLKTMLLEYSRFGNKDVPDEKIKIVKDLMSNIESKEPVTPYDEVKKCGLDVMQLISISRTKYAEDEGEEALALAQNAYDKVCELLKKIPESEASYVVYVNAVSQFVSLLQGMGKFEEALKLNIEAIHTMRYLTKHFDNIRSCVMLTQIACMAINLLIEIQSHKGKEAIYRFFTIPQRLYDVLNILQGELRKVDPQSPLFIPIGKQNEYCQSIGLMKEEQLTAANLESLIDLLYKLANDYITIVGS